MNRVRRTVMLALATGLAGGFAAAADAQNARLVEWVESNPVNVTDRIALGYPPPIPVDTPLPFDGFRSYAGLRARHEDLAANTPWVHPETIGQTRRGRTLWAHRLGDADRLTPWGLPEPATLTNGGIHAREWQTPEVVTGILELLATAPADDWLIDYLRDHVNMVVIPVLNVDGFLQTQRTPTLNWVGEDPNDSANWPRDGRMRRKNLLNTDENLYTPDDHLNGVDLNRNNPPYWNTSGGSNSSSNVRSLLYHGTAPRSEPETRALDAAAGLGPANRLRLYTDVHSFAQTHFWVRTANDRLAVQTERVLDLFTDHHQSFPAGKWYAWSNRNNVANGYGIGTTDEYFTVEYEVPSWTLEVEPTGGQEYHTPLPGGGADYGGAGVNGHDGFILPESQIRRVREQLAQTFSTVYYRQSGPPHVQSVRVFDAASGALVIEADWDAGDEGRRERFLAQHAPLRPGRDYRLWLGFNKPMRWLVDGKVQIFPGFAADTVDTVITARVGSQGLALDLGAGPTTLLAPGGAPDGYRFYRSDALVTNFRIRATQANLDLLDDGSEVTLGVRTRDMTGLGLDGDPATVADWAGGHWTGYEDGLDNDSDFGGTDDSLRIMAAAGAAPEPFLLQPGIAAAWFDPQRNGEGFIIEMLAGGRATLYWFTYDEAGRQDWIVADGGIDGNRLRFPELLRVTGGVFGPGFDPDAVTREVIGEATFTWTGCGAGRMDWHIGNTRGRQSLSRLSRIQGLDCGLPLGRPIRQEAQYSGAWYDPQRSGEGFTVQVLEDDTALVYWFSYDTDGARRWFFGQGELVDGSWVFPTLWTTSGPSFGAGFDPGALDQRAWGRLELDLSCDGGEARWTTGETGFPDGSMPLVQLTRMDGPACPTEG